MSFFSNYWVGLLLILLASTVLGLSPMACAETTASSPAISKNVIKQHIDIEVFVRAGCPHCAKAEAFLAKLKQEQPSLNIVIHDIAAKPEALANLEAIAKQQAVKTVRVPAFQVGGELIIGYSDELSSGQLIRAALSRKPVEPAKIQDTAGSCEVESALSCKPENLATPKPLESQTYYVDFLGQRLSLAEIGLPLFTLAMGLLDGFNPCSIWVLILMISLLAPMQNRLRMLAIAGTFVAVEGLAYFVFMAAWLNLFLLIGLSRVSQIAIALLAIIAGALNLKDFWFLGQGPSLSIPESSKPGIYARIRRILQARNLIGALLGAVILALLVQIVEFMCTSGFPALYTRILTLSHLDKLTYYGYLLLYNIAYMFDDIIILAIGVITLSQRRLQEKEGRKLKLISGLVMLGLGVYLLV